jgi:hypothetical protein
LKPTAKFSRRSAAKTAERFAKTYLAIFNSSLLLIALCAFASGQTKADACAKLTALKLANAPDFKGLPAFCRVAATLTPSNDSDIKIEVWLPVANWNGKLMAVGNSGWSGAIGYAALGRELSRGYAATSTDTGHTGPSASFALGHPEKLADFAWRAVHEMTVQAKAIIAAHYGPAPKHSYWNGCSSGDREADAPRCASRNAARGQAVRDDVVKCLDHRATEHPRHPLVSG